MTAASDFNTRLDNEMRERDIAVMQRRLNPTMRPLKPGASRGVSGEVHDFMMAEGWSAIDARSDYKNDQRRGGITFREPEPGEFHVNEDVLRTGLEHSVGFKVEQIQSDYVRGGGPISADLKAMRDRVDARLLAVAATGTNMTALADAIGIGERTMDRALARARAAEGPA